MIVDLTIDEKDLIELPEGQRRALIALVGQGNAPSYEAAAKKAGIGVGTLYTHLKRVRDRRPDIYKFAMKLRRIHLEERHRQALETADEHSHLFHKNMLRMSNNQLKVALGRTSRYRNY